MQQITPKTLCKCHPEYRKDEWCQKWCSRANDKSGDPRKVKAEEPEKKKRAHPRNEDGTLMRTFGNKPLKVLCITTGQEYESVIIASIKADVSVTAIRRCCRGQQAEVKCLKFKYVAG